MPSSLSFPSYPPTFFHLYKPLQYLFILTLTVYLTVYVITNLGNNIGRTNIHHHGNTNHRINTNNNIQCARQIQELIPIHSRFNINDNNDDDDNNTVYYGSTVVLVQNFLISYIWNPIYYLVFNTPHFVSSMQTKNRNNNNIDNFPRHQIGFQAHSVNDLRQWRSMYRKGSRSFKIDPHILYDRSTYNNNNNDQLILTTKIQPTSARLVLSHDEPTDQHRKINSTRYDDLIDILDELNPNRGNTLGELLIKDNQPNIHIQLCLKGVPDPCSVDPHGKRNVTNLLWVQLMDTFFEQVNQRLLQGQLYENIEFVLDGGGKPFDCLKWCWMPWPSVWISNDAKSPPQALTMDDPPPWYKRYSILNSAAFFSEWERLQSINYGKFSKGKYPYQVWEPSDQADIQKYVKLFQSGPVHEPGYHIVSNLDPVQVSSWSEANGVKNQLLVAGRSTSCPIGAHIFDNGEMFVGFNFGGQATAAISKYATSGTVIFSNPPTRLPWSRMTGSSDGKLLALYSTTTLSNTQTATFATLSNPDYSSTSSTNSLFHSVREGIFLPSIQGRLLALRPLIYYHYYYPYPWFLHKRHRKIVGNGYLAVFLMTPTSTECAGGLLVLRASSWNNTDDYEMAIPFISRVCVQLPRGCRGSGSSTTTSIFQSKDKSNDATTSTTNIVDADIVEMGDNESDGALVVFSEDSSSKTIYNAFVRFTSSSSPSDDDDDNEFNFLYPVMKETTSAASATAAEDYLLRGCVEAKRLTIGSHPRLTRTILDVKQDEENDDKQFHHSRRRKLRVVDTDDTDDTDNDDTEDESSTIANPTKSVITLVVTDSYCFNSDENNKRAYPRVCDNVATSTSQIMTYTMGSPKQWLRRNVLTNRTITACESELLHGTFDVGLCPSVTSLPPNFNGNLHSQLLVVHAAPSGATNIHVERKCGTPSYRDALVRTVFPFSMKSHSSSSFLHSLLGIDEMLWGKSSNKFLDEDIRLLNVS
jgi:hypothetical protein